MMGDGARPRKRVPTVITGASMTKQSFAEQSDINAIMRKYASTGLPVELFNKREPRYGDFTSVEDYREQLHRVMDMEEAFQRLPADLRDHCKNDPAELLAIAYDPERFQELRKFGLLAPEEKVDQGVDQAKPVKDNPIT